MVAPALLHAEVSLPEQVRGQLGLPVPGEDPLPVAHHPPDLLLRHEVGEHPGHLPQEPAPITAEHMVT